MTDYLPEAKALARNYRMCIEGMAKRGPIYTSTKAKAQTLESLIAEVERLRAAEQRRKQPKSAKDVKSAADSGCVRVEYKTQSGETKVGYVKRKP